MPDDERDSEDLFEDLDKFFAPIKDVDWDEPEEGASPAATTDEPEHVTVRSKAEPVVTVPSATGEAVEGEDEEEQEPAVLEGEDEGDWYDTASLEPVDEALGGTADEEALDAITGPAEMERPD